MSRTDELQSYRISIIGLMAITNRLLRAEVSKKNKRPDLPWSETERLIDEWIHSESDRKLLKEKLHNEDVTFEQLAEAHCTSVQNVKKRFYRAKNRLYSKITKTSV